MLHPKKNIVMSVAWQALTVVMNNHVDKQLIMMYKYNSCWHCYVVSVQYIVAEQHLPYLSVSNYFIHLLSVCVY